MFYPASNFDLVEKLESNWEVIRDEMLSISQSDFDPWLQRSMHGEGWSVFGLAAIGRQFKQAVEYCPQTTKILQAIPGVALSGFSRMAPGTHILPHCGWAYDSYRLHLGLDVPSGCRLRVADETRSWKNGKCLVFDDTVEHEAWNDSTEVRTTLMVDFLRPGINEFSIDHIPPDVAEYARSMMDLG